MSAFIPCTPISEKSALNNSSDDEFGGDYSIPGRLEQTPEAIARREARKNIKVRLMSRDNRLLKVNYTFLECSETLVYMIDGLDMNSDNSVDEAIDVPMVDFDMLKKIFRWARFHFYAESSTEEKHRKKIESYDAKFLEVNEHRLVEMLMAAFFLKIDSLEKMVYKKISETNTLLTEEAFKKLDY